MIVYKIKNKINGKAYIGQTVQPLKNRLAQHYSKNDTVIQKAIKKYGKDSFDVSIIDVADDLDQLNSKEEFWISFYRTLTTQGGYNVKLGGNNARLTEKEKEVVSKKTKEAMNKPEIKVKLGRVWTKEEKEAKSKQMKGRKLSKEHKEAISKSMKGKKKSKEHVRNIIKGKTRMKYKKLNALESEGVNNEQRFFSCQERAKYQAHRSHNSNRPRRWRYYRR